MKKILTIIMPVIMLSACSQIKKENIDVKISKYKDSILSTVKYFENKPEYYIRPSRFNSLYEIRMNDQIIDQSFTFNSKDKNYFIKSFFDAQEVLDPSGLQKISYIIYPRDKNKIDSTAAFDIEVKFKDSNDDRKTVLIHESPVKKDGKDPEYIGMSSYSSSFDFQLEPPYAKKVNWFESKDLREEKEIEQQLLAAYNEIKRIYQEGDLDTFIELYRPIFEAEAQAKYLKKDEGYELNMERLHPLFYKTSPQLEKEYVVKFYANGTLATLERKKKDSLSYNESAFWLTYDKDLENFPDELMINSKDNDLFYEKGIIPKKRVELYLFFHKPQGADSLKLATDIFREEELLNGED